MGEEGVDMKKFFWFNYYLVRTPSLNYSRLTELNINASIKLFDKLDRQLDRKEKLTKELSGSLYNHIKLCQDAESRGLLLSLKRKTYNGKVISSLDIEKIQDHISANTLKLLLKYVQFHQSCVQIECDLNKTFHEELNSKEELFIRNTTHPKILRGLLYTNLELLTQLLSVTNKLTFSNKQNKRISQTLIKFLLRTCTKPTPFASFSRISMHTLKLKKGRKSVKALKSNRIIPNVQILELLINLMFSPLCSNNQVRLKANNSIQLTDRFFTFYQNLFNVESIRQLKQTPLLIDIFELSKHSKIFNKESLVKNLVRKKYLVDLDDLNHYIDKLIAVGFLELDIQFPSKSYQWPQQTQAILTKHKLKLTSVVKFLKKLDRNARVLEQASIPTARKILIQTYSDLLNLIQEFIALQKKGVFELEQKKQSSQLSIHTDQVNQSGNKFTRKIKLFPETMFYENNTVNDTHNLSLSQIKPVLSTIRRLNELLRPLNWNKLDGEELYKFYTANFQGHSEVSLLTFFEEYKKDKNKYVVTKSLRENILFSKQLSTRIKNKNLNLDFLDSDLLLKRSRKEIKNVTYQNSQTVILQFHREKEQPTVGILNGIGQGYGRLYGRFLYHFDQSVTEAIRLNNKKNNESLEYTFTENNDFSFFNGSLHPVITSKKIYSPLVSSEEGIQYLDLSSLVVKRDTIKKQVYLFDTSEQSKIAIFNLDLDDSKVKSELFQFLNFFSCYQNTNYYSLLKKINCDYEKGQDSYILPRITYRGNLVLQRKTWVIDRDELPIRLSLESDYAYWKRVMDWKKNLDLPEIVFVHIFNQEDKKSITPELAKVFRVRKDDYKPIHINFSNYYCILVLEKIIARTFSKLYIVESLPIPIGQKLKYTKNPYSEFLFQWYETYAH